MIRRHNPRRLLAAIALVLVATCTGLHAEHYMPHIWLGGRAGMTMSRMTFSPSVPQKWIMGSEGTVTFRYSEEKVFGVIAELGWTQRGWSENFGEDNPLRYERQLTYLKLPVLSHIYFGSPRFKGFVNLGPEIAFLLGSKISANFDYEHPATSPDWPSRTRRTEQLTADIKNKFDYGITAGLGMEFYLQPRHSIVLEARFYYGLGNIFPASKADTFGASRNMTVNVTLGYNFRLK
ncbi:MAG: PorT family protein [Muribaculaceae bacterium]|nr:PorT family protein [Muribaculaceae bacterium]